MEKNVCIYTHISIHTYIYTHAVLSKPGRNPQSVSALPNSTAT